LAARADSVEVFAFFNAEAQVISASLEPQELRRAPATVYLLSHDEITASGAETIWDALRLLPGVDVISTRANHGEVSLRGMNKPLNNRTLVLLDGKTVLNGYFDFANWESIPVTLDEIDRIEVVEGAASALYGANAINGVINIITRRPDQMRGVHGHFGVGEIGARTGAIVAATANERWGFRAGGTWRTVNRFEAENLLSSEVGHASALVELRPSPGSRISLSGGLSNVNTELSGGVIGTAYEDGLIGFLRADASRGGTRVRAFWNRGRTVARELNSLSEPNLHYDTYDVNLERSVPSGPKNRLVVGGSYRQNVARSRLFGPGRKQQDLWAIFLEDRWSLARRIDLTVSARLDRHPLAGEVVSPRGSVVYEATPRHIFRASVGSAFRNPTLTENYVLFQTDSPNPGTDIPNPPYSTIRYSVVGNRDLEGEKLLLFELAHSMRLKRLRTTASMFHYVVRDIITTSTTQQAGSPPTFVIEQSFINMGVTRASGGELALELALSRALTALANYSYQSLTSDEAAQGIPPQSPRHKANGGLRYHDRGWSAGASVNWVDHTAWPVGLASGSPGSFGRVDPYAIVNAAASYAFDGDYAGLTLRISAFNIADHRHYEILPALSPTEPGQFGEVIGRRIVGKVSYAF
jgi:iron complex outermembrane receptor protein